MLLRHPECLTGLTAIPQCRGSMYLTGLTSAEGAVSMAEKKSAKNAANSGRSPSAARKSASAKATKTSAAKTGAKTAAKKAASGRTSTAKPAPGRTTRAATPSKPTSLVPDGRSGKSGKPPNAASVGGSWKLKTSAPRRPAGKRAPAPARQPSANDNLSQELQDYLEAFIAELDHTVVPAVLRRLRAGAAALSPKELARRMLAVAPAPAPANKMAEQVGPEFYDTAGVMVVLARPGADPVSKQAVEHRRRRRTVLAVQTSDNRWIYPTWQFRDHDVMPGLAEALAVFGGQSMWSVATWLTTSSVDFDGLTAVQWLEAGRDREHLLRMARRTADRWAA